MFSDEFVKGQRFPQSYHQKKSETHRNFDKSLKYILTNSYCFLAYTYGPCPYDLRSSKWRHQ